MRVAECRNFNDFTGLMMLADRCSNKIIERVRTQGSGREQRSENHSRERNECFWHSGPRLEAVIVSDRYPTDLQLDARRASQIVVAWGRPSDHAGKRPKGRDESVRSMASDSLYTRDLPSGADDARSNSARARTAESATALKGKGACA